MYIVIIPLIKIGKNCQGEVVKITKILLVKSETRQIDRRRKSIC